MAKAFKYGLKGITGFLEPAERELLRSLIDDVISMLQPVEHASQDPLAALIGLDMDVQEPADRAGKLVQLNVRKYDDGGAPAFRQSHSHPTPDNKITALDATAMSRDKAGAARP